MLDLLGKIDPKETPAINCNELHLAVEQAFEQVTDQQSEMLDTFTKNMEMVVTAFLNDDTKYKPYKPIAGDHFNSILRTKIFDIITKFLTTWDQK